MKEFKHNPQATREFDKNAKCRARNGRPGERVDGVDNDSSRMGIFRRLRAKHDLVDGSSGKHKPQMADSDENGDNETSLWRLYCINSTVHGLKYLSDQRMHWYERIIWIAMITWAATGILYVSYKVQLKFATNRLSTVVESTSFPIYEIPYPAVTVCNYNRINWKRVPDAINLFLPNATTETVDKFTQILRGFNNLEWGSFDAFSSLSNVTFDDLDHINLTDLYHKVYHRCDELFIKTCWWRNKYVDCCTLFFEQKSEYGFCFAFNSETNPTGQRRAKEETNYPWRTSNYGDWSGLRVGIQLSDDTRMPGIKAPSGVLVNINHPCSWPNSAHFVPTDTQTTIVIKPTISYLASDMYSMSVEDRECLFEEEVSRLGYQTLPGLEYMRPNCISACRQAHMLSWCNCTLDLFHPSASHRQCSMNSLKCLTKYDAVFNYLIPPKGNKYFDDEEIGMQCNCITECKLIEYGIEVSPINKQKGRMVMSDYGDNSEILLEIHFQQANMVRYRTALVFDWMDLLVSFGGIAGLFLGCSLLSFFEAFLYAILGLVRTLQTYLLPPQNPKKRLTSKHVWVQPFTQKLAAGSPGGKFN